MNIVLQEGKLKLRNNIGDSYRLPKYGVFLMQR